MRVLGIDPGTRSFDLCGLDDGEVFFEEVLNTYDLAKRPSSLIDAVERAMPLDLIAGPSGYGVELTYLKDLKIDDLRDWYLTYILLLRDEDLATGLKRGDPGISVYSAMVETAMEMKRRDWPVCYLPGVIELPTVPKHRKINKLDIGTTDKMCIGILGTYDQSRRLKIPYSEVSFILVEMGFGYNAVLGVSGGKIVDGIGGTTGGIGFLSAGSLDLELVQLVKNWDKSDVFAGGGASVSGKSSPEEIVESTDENSKIAGEGMIESLVKGTASMMISVSDAKEILISGRLTRIRQFREKLARELSKLAPTKDVEWLPDVKKTKEAAQGYAMVADGLIDGKFSELVNWMEIKKARGTALDYIYHPKGKKLATDLRSKFFK